MNISKVDPAPGFLESQFLFNNDISIPRFDQSRSFSAESDFDETREIQYERDMDANNFDQFMKTKVKQTVSYESSLQNSPDGSQKHRNVLDVEFFEEPIKSNQVKNNLNYSYFTLNSVKGQRVKS